MPAPDHVPDAHDETRDRLDALVTILNSLPAMVGYWDAGLRNRFANAAYLTFFGISPTGMDGVHIRELLGDELFGLNEPYIEGALAGEEQAFEREIPDPGGGPARYTQAAYIPDIRHEQVQGFVALVTDITRRERAEQRVRDMEQSRRELLEWMLRAEERDRGRIARELHDNTVQSLVGLQVQLGRIRQALEHDPPRSGRLVSEASSMVDQALTETRRLMFDLQPQAFAEHGLRGILTELVEHAGRVAGFECAVDVPETRYPAIVEELVARTVREAVLNAREHSRATVLSVTIVADDARVYGSVVDDGVGFDAATATPGRSGHGLEAARHRLQMAGGDAIVESALGAGCTVQFTIPVAFGS